MKLEIQFKSNLSIGQQVKCDIHSRHVYKFVDIYVIMAVGAFHSCTLKRT